MNSIGFFTPVQYGQEAKTVDQIMLEKIDSYFYLCGKKAVVIQEKTKSGDTKVILVDEESSLLAVAGKVLSYVSLIAPLAMLIAKALLRSIHTFRLVDPQKKLEKGLNISNETIATLERLHETIRLQDKNEEIKWISMSNAFVFKLRKVPELIFKTSGYYNATLERFQNTIKGKEVCITYHLGLLIIPQTKLISINGYLLIAEQCLDFHRNESDQETLFHTSELNETLRQLVIFIAKTRFDDIAWRNIPILNESPDYMGPKRFALFDLEGMKSSVNGIFGNPEKRNDFGLIGCAVSEQQIDLILSEARNQGIPFSERQAEDAKIHRLKELQFYQTNGIKDGGELIQINANLLDFSNYPTQNPKVLNELAKALIRKMNSKIIKSSSKDSVRDRRAIYVDPKSLIKNDNIDISFQCVIKKLIDIGVIFACEPDKYEPGYHLQP